MEETRIGAQELLDLIAFRRAAEENPTEEVTRGLAELEEMAKATLAAGHTECVFRKASDALDSPSAN